MIGILFGLWFIVLINDGESGDFEVGSIGDGLKYVFQVFIGTGDLGGVGDQTIGIIFMVGATFFGTLILTNLLIALMTTEYENVREKAKQEVILNQIELTFDLSIRSRSMPPPLNIIVYLSSSIIYIINVITSCCFRYNMYSYIHFDSFKQLKARKYKYGFPLFISLILWVVFAVGIYYHNEHPIIILATSVMLGLWIMIYCLNPKCVSCINNSRLQIRPAKYFQDMKRQQLLKWHCFCLYRCCRKKKQKDDPIFNIHHQGCYAELIINSKSSKSKRLNNLLTGITIDEYIDEYEEKKTRINSDDKAVLKQLISKSLLCRKCYRPLKENQLTTPFDALLDFSSAIVFVVFPIAYFPLVLLFGVLAIKEKIADCFEQDDDAGNDNPRDYDAEYFPRKDTL